LTLILQQINLESTHYFNKNFSQKIDNVFIVGMTVE